MSDPHHGVGVGRQGTIETVSVSEAGVDRLKPGAIGLLGVIFVDRKSTRLNSSH